MKKKQKVMYRDGYVKILEEKIESSEFNAKKNGKTYKYIQKLPFNFMSKRVQDKEYISQISDKQLDLKIECPNCGMEFKKYSVIINDDLSKVYDIAYYDETSDKYYFYLCSVGGKKDVIIEET